MAITHVGDSTYSSTTTASSLANTYSSTDGNTLVVWVELENSSNTAISLTSVTDTAGNTWTVIPGAGYWYSPGSAYLYLGLAYCVNAAHVTSVTAYFSGAVSSAGFVQVSEFAGVPAGSGLIGSATATGPGSYTSYSTPAVTLPAGETPAIVLACAGATPAWTGVSGGTNPAGTAGDAWNIATSSGSESVTFTSGSSTTVLTAITAVIGPMPLSMVGGSYQTFIA